MRERQSIALVTRHGISSPDARTTTPRRSCRDPRRAIRGLQGAAQGYCRGCADEAAGGCPVPSACRSAQSTGTVGLAGQPALEPGRQRDGGSARCRAGAARSCRRSSGGRVAKRLRPGLMAQAPSGGSPLRREAAQSGRGRRSGSPGCAASLDHHAAQAYLEDAGRGEETALQPSKETYGRITIESASGACRPGGDQ